MEDRDRLAEAFDLAVRLHDGQDRKGTSIPYVSHLMAVASLVLEHGGTEDQAIAALLHDGPEDQGGREVLSEIRRRFGEGVAVTVEECTDTFEDPKPPWRPRKEMYLRRLSRVQPETLLVSLADKTHNLRSILRDHAMVGDALWERFAGAKDGTRWYYESLLEAYRDRLPEPAEPLFAEYERMVERLREL